MFCVHFVVKVNYPNRYLYRVIEMKKPHVIKDANPAGGFYGLYKMVAKNAILAKIEQNIFVA